jgi:lysophospholipase L1-like esterase
MKRLRSSYLQWPNLLLIGVLVLISFSIRPSITHPRPELEREKIGFIGDSITHGPKGGKSVVDAEMDNLGSRFVAVNQGVNGATSTDWAPGGPLFDNALAVFKAQNVRVVSIMLGTNDARRDRAILPAVYKKNIQRIIGALLSSGTVTRVVVNYPPYAVPGTGGLWDGVSIARLKLYAAQLDEVAIVPEVMRGDTRAFNYFEQRPYELLDGVHPNSLGIEALGRLWADAYKRAVASQVYERQLSSLAIASYDRV